MKFNIEIDLSNFDPDIAGLEIKKILEPILEDVSYSADWSECFYVPVKDINGNTIGKCVLK